MSGTLQYKMLLLKLLIVMGCVLMISSADNLIIHNKGIPRVIPGEYVIILKDGIMAPSLETQAVITVLNKFDINGLRMWHVSATDDGVDLLREDPNIKTIEANSRSLSIANCNEQETGQTLWGLTRTSSREMPDYDIGTYQYNDYDNGHGVDAYVVDTGIYLEHNDFGGRAVHGFTSPGITEGDDDLNGHGTHVSGIIGGTTYGIAKGVNLIAVKALNSMGSGMVSDLIAALEYITVHHTNKDHKKSVMNLSIGMPASAAVDSAVEAAINAGVNAATVAGNSNTDACLYSPARVPGAMTAAASDISDSLRSSSNYGICVDAIAPGTNIRSAYIGSPDASAVMSGSSMAGPHIAGWVARYLSTFADNQEPSPSEVKEAYAEISTKDVIYIPPDKEGTANHLIYASCDWIPPQSKD